MPHRGLSVRPGVLLCLLAAALAPGPGAEAQTPSPSPDYLSRARELLGSRDAERMLAQLREIYAQAKASGERVPGDLWTWVRQDLERAGGWEYRVVKGERDSAALESQLNALGRERWECLSVSPAVGRGEPTLVLKRPVKSYLGHLNVRDVLRVLPEGN